MNIQNNNNNNIFFQAKLVDKATIKKLKNYRYKNEEVNIIALEKSDLPKLEEIVLDWKTEYVKYLYRGAKERLRPVELKYNIYAITLQKDNFKELLPQKVLGLCSFENNVTYNEIGLLEVKPEYSYQRKTFKSIISLLERKKRKYKNIGTEIINFLKKKTHDRSLKVYSDPDCIEFYEKNGFKKETSSSNQRLIWNDLKNKV